MKAGISIFLWKLSVALYLLANGVLGLNKGGDFATILRDRMGMGDAFVIIASFIAFLAGLFILLEMLNVQFSLLDTLILIIAVIWIVYVIIEIVSWITNTKSVEFWPAIQMLAVHTMVLASLMIASRKFG